jgi:hypothetical protein
MMKVASLTLSDGRSLAYRHDTRCAEKKLSVPGSIIYLITVDNSGASLQCSILSIGSNGDTSIYHIDVDPSVTSEVISCFTAINFCLTDGRKRGDGSSNLKIFCDNKTITSMVNDRAGTIARIPKSSKYGDLIIKTLTEISNSNVEVISSAPSWLNSSIA